LWCRGYLAQQPGEREDSPGTTAPSVAGRCVSAVDSSISPQTWYGRMIKRASKTCYFLNRRARYLALIRRGVRLPASIGVWIPIANPERTARETRELLDATYPQLDAHGLSFVTLLNDFAVAEFENELRRRELLRRQKGRAR
jgi:hypothetical protein